MKKLLYIESSPRKQHSISIEAAHKFLDFYMQAHPTDEVITLDLWQEELPIFDGDVIAGRHALMQGLSHTEAQRKAWRQIESFIQQFRRADKYLFSVPMWNFSIPYRLKHYLDILIQPSYTFSFSPQEGFQGLIKGKPVLVIYARGGSYPEATPAAGMDFQKKYMETVLRFIGFEDIRSIVLESTAGGDGVRKKLLDEVQSDLRSKLHDF